VANPQAMASVTLDSFLGLVTNFAPESLPMGASPLAWDVDFLAGEVFTRGGLVSSYVFPSGSSNLNYVKSFPLASGILNTLALDASGILWAASQANLFNMVSLNTNVLAGSYMLSTTLDDVEYMCFSNLLYGTDIPRQYNPQPAVGGYTLDRISQVGPGAPPTFQATLSVTSTQVSITSWAASGGIVTFQAVNAFTAGEVITLSGFAHSTFFNNVLAEVLGTGLTGAQFQIAFTGSSGSTDTGIATPQYGYGIASITQLAAQNFNGQTILWSAGPGQTTAGTTITCYYGSAGSAQDANLVNAFNSGQAVYVYIVNAPWGNGTQLITGVGSGRPPSQPSTVPYFTFGATGSSYQISGNPPNSGGNDGTYQLTVATLTAQLGIPNLTAGDEITITGASPSGWNSVWAVTDALTSGTYLITQTAMTSANATYNWTWAGSGTAIAPTAGQLVTVIQTTNGNGIFNVADAVIASVTGGPSSGTFVINSLGSAGQNVPATAESGQAATSGKTFQFDPGQVTLGGTQNPIFGNAVGNQGLVAIVGANSGIGAGTRQAVCFFETRNGLKTACSAPITFTTNLAATYLYASNVPIGPPDVIRRWIAFTSAGPNGIPGPNFYTLDTPVTYTINNQTYRYTATYIDDNVSTSAKFTFTDAVLLAGEEIDVQGNNLFAQIELGSSAWNVAYAQRMFYGLEQNKVLNFTNLSFDGGYVPNTSGNNVPLGWGLDAVSNSTPLPSSNITAFQIFTGSSGSFTLGPNACTIATPNGWQGANNIQMQDGLGATVSINPGSTSGLLQATAFNFGVPSGATVLGITAVWVRKSWSLPGLYTGLVDSNVSLLKAGSAVGSNHASGGGWISSFQSISYGGPSDLWGASWSPSDINSSGFGIQLSVNNPGGPLVQKGVADVDFVSLSVTYTLAGTNYVIFQCINSFSPGMQVAIAGLSVGTYLNGQIMTVLSSNLTGTEFSANTTHAATALITDSGTATPQGSTTTTSGASGALISSPIFGNAYYLNNQTASMQTAFGMIVQNAYQDAYNVPIILPNVLYSVRVTCSNPSGNTNGDLIIDLTDSSSGLISGTGLVSGYGVTYGSFILPFSSMGQSTQVFSGTLLTSPFTTGVPTGLLLRLWAADIGVGADVLVDRLEIFPTATPLNATQIRVSYADNFEAFDANTGVLGLAAYNTQPCYGAFEMHDELYFLQSGSMQSTQDVPGVEPSNPDGGWKVGEVSNKVGTCGIHAYDYGEEWALTACRNGVYGFNGGQPIRIDFQQREIWELINWSYGYTIWLANDLPNSRIMVGVPLPTPNQWLPLAPANANPVSPNVVLMWNYQNLDTFEEIVAGRGVHTTMFGTLAAVDMRLKMSIWQITSPYAGFITQADGATQALTICNGLGNQKIYQFSDDQLSDDGVAINSFYTTFGFVDAAKAKENPLLGLTRKVFNQLQLDASGSGNLDITLYPNYILTPSTLAFNPYAQTVVPLAITETPADDYWTPVNVEGNRVFVSVSTDAFGEAFHLSKMILIGIGHPFASVNPNV
jgi:hypothetical protein